MYGISSNDTDEERAFQIMIAMPWDRNKRFLFVDNSL